MTRWVQPKILVLITNFFSLNFRSIEIEGERLSSCQSKRTLEEGERGEEEVIEKEQGQTREQGG